MCVIEALNTSCSVTYDTCARILTLKG